LRLALHNNSPVCFRELLQVETKQGANAVFTTGTLTKTLVCTQNRQVHRHSRSLSFCLNLFFLPVSISCSLFLSLSHTHTHTLSQVGCAKWPNITVLNRLNLFIHSYKDTHTLSLTHTHPHTHTHKCQSLAFPFREGWGEGCV